MGWEQMRSVGERSGLHVNEDIRVGRGARNK